MLYLAEVQKKGGGLLGGGGKAELKLLACQRSEQSWTAVPGEEVLPSDEINAYASGALVLVDLTANRQVQRIQEAGRPLVSILQNFSRLQEKFKTQEEEIEQWKQSLTYQSQELNRREMEMESRREQLQQMEEDFEQLERQRQEVETLRDDINQQKEAYDRNRQELEGAWEHLRGEMRRMEEQQSSMQQTTVLDEDKAQIFQDLLHRLSGSVLPAEPLQEQLNLSFEILTQHQERLTQHWQTLEQKRSQLQQQQHEIDQQAQDLHNRWQEWHQAQDTLERAKAELKAQQSLLNVKQDYAQDLSVQLHNSEELHQQLYRLAESSDSIKIGVQIDVSVLEKLPTDELQKLAQDLESDLEKLSRFVENQEEELTLKQQEIDGIKEKVQAANEYDRLNLENELTDEQDGYQMLNETLVGQRRSLQERKSILTQHQSVLRRRQGLPDPEGQSSNVLDLSPLMTQVDTQRQQQAETLRNLESQIEQVKAAIAQTEQLVTSQVAEQETKRTDLKQQEMDLDQRKATLAEVQGRVNLYHELLQPVQDSTDELRRNLEAISGSTAHLQETGNHQAQAIAEMQQALSNLTNSPELAVS